jgi:hypothetical protein
MVPIADIRPDATFALAAGSFQTPRIVADAAKEREPFLVGTLQRCGVLKRVMRNGPTGGNRTDLLGIITDGQNVVERLAGKLVYASRKVAGNVYAHFASGRDSRRSEVVSQG